MSTPKPTLDLDDRSRDRSRTELSIIAAARAVLVEKGFGGWGVNAIARAAGCDKQLIYRYYGGLDGLAEALGAELAHDIEHALSAAPIPQVTHYGELVAALIDAQLEMLRNHPVMQRIIAWELSEANALTRAFAEARSQALIGWLARIKGGFTPPPGVDAPAVNAVLIAAVQQMVLSAASIGAFAGMPLASPADWDRLRATIQSLVSAIYAAPDPAE
ncbi:TetR/AcrR family transcriptional regulator [Sphingomonas sp.]|jgi:AcrR family transcriptional regulator|uniref:TetR/AcrR family transcriptional regulator n=1 Tax=Sphingomonas sp. TaxID=28214 RepID=UPI0017C9E96C|nr:TetR/AcrR family transcriptional regulator [Sphingomonas sp.]MBA4760996.1 TetR/AcrR family transcriptional regulator [Sphingomonas sp.]